MASFSLDSVRGFLFDLDGVLFVGNQVIEGAIETVEHLKKNHFPCRFVSNTTTRSLDSLYKKVSRLGLPIQKREILTPPRIAAMYLREKGRPRCLLILEDDTKTEFAEFPVDEENPEVIVVGHYGNRWNYDLLDRLFKMVMRGAELVALHKGRFRQVAEGLKLDIGAFVTGLEYVTGKEATVIGKPSQMFFELALQDLGLPANQVAMVGDDIYNDIGGARNAGMSGILVKTGKYRGDFVSNSSVIPDLIIDSVASLREML